MKFSAKLSILLLSITVSVVAIVSFVVYTLSHKALEKQIHHEMQSHAAGTLDMIDRTLFERIADIKVLSTDSIISSPESTPKQITERLIDYRNQYKTYASLSFFDLNRIRIADTTGLHIGKQHDMVKYWEDVLEGKISAASDIRVAEESNMAIIYFASPVKDKTGATFGIVTARMPITKLYEITKEAAGIQGQERNLQIDLVDKDGLLLFSNYNRKGILKDNLLEHKEFKAILIAEEGAITTIRDPLEDDTNFCVHAHEHGHLDFPGSGWAMIVRVPVEVAFAPVIQLRNAMAAISITIVVITIAASLIFSLTISRPITKLRDVAAEIGRGDLDTRIEIKSKDEIGQLAASFNTMVEDLSKTTASRDELNAANQQLQDSQQQLKASNQQLRATNQQLQFEITERKKAEESLRLSEANLNRAQEVAHVGSWYLDLTKNNLFWSNEIYRIFEVSTDQSPIAYEKFLEIVHPDDRAFVNEAWTNALNNNALNNKDSYNIEHRILADGKLKWVREKAEVEFDEEGKAIRGLGIVQDITERKQAEEALEESETKYRTLVEKLPAITYIAELDEASTTLYISPQVKEFLGVTSEEYKADIDMWRKQLHPDDRDRVMKELTKSHEICSDFSSEYRMVTKDGSVVWFRDEASVVYDPNRKPLFLQGIMYDITERKQAETKLKQIAEEWITTFDSITDMVSIHDKDFKIVRANKAFANAFKMKPGEIIGKTCYELIHGTKEPPPFCPHKCTLDNGKPHRAEFFEPHLGIHVEASTSPIFDENGQIMASVHIAKDITERKQVECEIQDIAKFPSENPNPVLRIQKDGKILYGNDAALPLLALWKSKVGGVVPAKWRRLVDLTFESEKAISNEEEVDGSIFSFVIAPVADNDYANMYASDVTERKQAEVELRAAQEKLIETAHRAGMAEVAADVLHNVGNVLNSINVSTTVIREKVTSSEVANLEKVASIINEHTDDLGTFLTKDPQGKNIPVYLTEVSKCLQNEKTDIIDRLRVLVDNVQHIKDIVGMQQDYTKVSGVEVQTSLSKLVEDAIQINSAGLERHGTRLIREFEELGDVEIDKQKVLQILVNLISNAKYALSGSNKEEKLLTIRIYKHGEDRFRIEVADNGVGISEDNLAKIFSYGFTTKKDGHGVGLHSSALAAKEMGGSLTVYSDGLGQGATFTLELPFKSVEVMK